MVGGSIEQSLELFVWAAISPNDEVARPAMVTLGVRLVWGGGVRTQTNQRIPVP